MRKNLKFEEKYEILIKYYNQNGNINIKQKQIYENYPVGKWLANFREAYKNNKLPEDQVEKLNKLNMLWSDVKKVSSISLFNKKYEILKAYYEEYGNLNISTKQVYKSYPVGDYVKQFRDSYRKQGNYTFLSESQIKQLESIDMVWNPKQEKEIIKEEVPSYFIKKYKNKSSRQVIILYKYLNNKLLLSYTSLNNYYKCKFKYYLNHVLKINIIRDDFAILLGEVCHYILSCMDNDDFDIDTLFDNYLKTKREFSKREMFHLNNIKEEIVFIVSTIRKQMTYTTFDKSMKEKCVYVNKDRNIKVTFKGVIDKVLYKEEDDITYLVVIDYKTGSSSIDIKNMEYGLGMQLPIYLYLSSKLGLKNVKVVGFYLQKLFNTSLDNSKDYEEEKEGKLKLDGYSINNENILSKFDTTYHDSKLIKSMKTTNNGFYKYSKVLTSEEMDEMTLLADDMINKAIDGILEGDFKINPKVINGSNESCSLCEYKDICYKRERDITYINREDYNE